MPDDRPGRSHAAWIGAWGLLLCACGGSPSGSPAEDAQTPPDAESDARPDATVDAGPSEGVLEGPTDALALTAIEDLPWPEASVIDSEFGRVVADRVLVMVSDNATIAEINAAVAGIGGTLEGADSALGLLVVRLADDAGFEALVSAVAAANQAPGVAVATFDGEAPSLALPPYHKSPDGLDASPWDWESTGANWGFEQARVPYAWNLRDRMRRNLEAQAGFLKVGVVDGAFDTSHPDLNFAETTTTTGATSADLDHGNGVVSVIGARHDKVGIEGVLPVAVPIAGRLRGTSSTSLKAILELVGQGYRVINFSQGQLELLAAKWVGDPNLPYRIGDALTWREAMDQRGAAFSLGLKRAIKACESRNRTRCADVLLFCAAGNTPGYQARDGSGCANAAATGDDHFLIVESSNRSGARAAHSSEGGHLRAPGEGVGVATANGYRIASGTSYAAPFAAAAAALVWAVEPALSYLDVRTALLEGASKRGAEPKVPLLDVWGAVQQIDQRRPESAVAADLVDVDDCTADGNLRVDPTSGEVVSALCDAQGRRGDGCVDMSDFRAVRDAIEVAGDAGTAALDGGATNLKRDLNGDGVVSPGFDYPAEGYFSRFDFNADNDVDAADLGVMLARWGACRDSALVPQVQGFTDGSPAVADLDLGSTVDLQIPVGALPGETLVKVTGVPGLRVEEATKDSLSLPWDETWLWVTAPSCDNLRVCATRALAGGFAEESCLEVSGAANGKDFKLPDFPAATPTTPPVAFRSCALGHPKRLHAYQGDLDVYREEPEECFAGDPTRMLLPSPDGEVVAMDTLGGGALVLMDATTGTSESVALCPGCEIYFHAWSADGQRLVLMASPEDSLDKWLYLVERSAGGASLGTLDQGESLGGAAFDRDKWIYYAKGADLYRVAVVPTATGQATCGLPEPELFAEGAPNGPIIEYRLPTGRPSPLSAGGVLLVSARTPLSEGWELGALNVGSGAYYGLVQACLGPHVSWSWDGRYAYIDCLADGPAWLLDVGPTGLVKANKEGLRIEPLGTLQPWPAEGRLGGVWSPTTHALLVSTWTDERRVGAYTFVGWPEDEIEPGFFNSVVHSGWVDASWSPKGDRFAAFKAIASEGYQLDIGLIDLASGSVDRITEAYTYESVLDGETYQREDDNARWDWRATAPWNP